MWQNYSGIISILVMFAIFYFLLIRPQQKRQKERQAMLAALKKGDRVITIGGIHGTIIDLDDDKVTLRVSETTKIVFERSAISTVVQEN
ncbi:MAG: preprotein translocase subunit YajC [Alicyclobacillaceae bacterium]|nr:preprotein translocase subunit YajC [Alicyclobacillaceae bacterium]